MAQSRRIVILQGHPDSANNHLCHAMAAAYREGAVAAGHQVREINVGKLDFPLLRRPEDFQTEEPPPDIRAAQETILWSEHMLIVYPLWHGSMPALLKGFFEQTFRHGFAIEVRSPNRWKRKLTGRSARVVVTMGMPALAYRWYFGAHSLKSLERNILGFCGIGPIRESLFGMVEAVSASKKEGWFKQLRELGHKGT